MSVHRTYLEPFNEPEKTDWKKKCLAAEARLSRVSGLTPYDVSEILSEMRTKGYDEWADVLEDVAKANQLRDDLLNVREKRSPTENLDLALERDRARIKAEKILLHIKELINDYF